MSEAIETAFLDAIRKNPDDDDARAVYADWLEERGDARGEYLRLEAQLNRIPLRLSELVKAINPIWLEAIARRYDVELITPGTNKIMTIKAVRTVTGLGLKDAKDIVDRASEGLPQRLRQNIDRQQADAIIAEFTQVLGQAGGSTATLRIVGTGYDGPPIDRSAFDAPATSTPSTEVVLVSVTRDQRISAIRVVRDVTGLPLTECKVIVDRVAAGMPHTIAHGLDAEPAKTIAAAFTGIATVVIR